MPFLLETGLDEQAHGIFPPVETILARTDREPSGRRARIAREYRERGWLGGSLWLSARVLEKALSPVVTRESYVLLAGPLISPQPPLFRQRNSIEVQPLTRDYLGVVLPLWPPAERARALDLIAFRLDNAYLGLVAWVKHLPLGLVWLSFHGDREELTGLDLRTGPGCCYTLDLRVAPVPAGQPAAIRLCASVVHEALSRGYSRLFLFTGIENRPMLRIARALSPCHVVGRIETLRVLGRPISYWRVGSARGRGGIVPLL